MCAKLQNILSLPNLSPSQMVPSCYTGAVYTASVLAPGKKAYVIGGQGIVDELRLLGVEAVGGSGSVGGDAGGDAADAAGMSEGDIEDYLLDPSVGAVVVGMCSDFTYRMVAVASLYLSDPSVHFVATNTDGFDILPSGRHQPAAGVMVSAIETAATRRAVNCGKPSTVLFDLLRREHGVTKENAIMVGDRIDTDIAFGFNHGMKTALVLSGCTTAEEAVRCLDREGREGGEDGDREEGGGGGEGAAKRKVEPSVILPFLGSMICDGEETGGGLATPMP